MTSSETERLTKSIKDEIIEEQQNHHHQQHGKKDRVDEDTIDEDSSNMEIENPFVHKVEWNDPYDKIRVSFLLFCHSLLYSINKKRV